MPELDEIYEAVLAALRSVGAEVTSPWFYFQIGLILAAAGVAHLGAAAIRARIDTTSIAMGLPAPLRLFVRVLIRSIAAALFALLMALARVTMVALTWPSRSYLLAIVALLAFAWVLIRCVTSVIHNELAVRLISLAAWFVAALSITGLLDPTTAMLDSVALVVGGFRLTPLLIIKIAVLLAVALWLASMASKFIEARITRSSDLTPSVQVLIVKLVRIALMAVAVVLVMGSVGIDLSALTIFGGAIGVGLGFGLQKIVANFISGIILLADKSVKPGDLVTIGDNFGRVSAMNTRYITVAAGDGREILIPNEDLVTQKVVNWTYKDRNTLVEVKFSANYEADPHVVCRLAVEVAEATPRVASFKPASCVLSEFGEYGMRFSLTFWITDPDAGMGNVRSDVMLALWDAFKREGIRVPYPVRDIRVRSALPIDAVIEQPAA
jgi:small-conductance mechanosensitive channel